jgi:hypothetical protein
MGTHLIDGMFQSDKYPTTPRGKVPLSVNDPTAQDLLWEYAQQRRSVDAEFSDDLQTALKNAGYLPVQRCAIVNWPCPVHKVTHGREAEELRAGIETIIAILVDDVGGEPTVGSARGLRVALQRLLDRVDASDSLAFREAIER